MCTIDEALTNLDDMDYVIDLLRKIGRTHTRFENYKPEIFWVSGNKHLSSLSFFLNYCQEISTVNISGYSRLVEVDRSSSKLIKMALSIDEHGS